MELFLAILFFAVLALVSMLRNAPPDQESSAPTPTITFEGLAGAWRNPHSPQGPLEEEAATLARLLVSEVELYNEDLLEEGIRNKSIYLLIGDDLERSHQMYLDRVPKDLSQNFFLKEVVRKLGQGDPKAFGLE